VGGTAAAAQLTSESGGTPDADLIDAYIGEATGEVLAAVAGRTSATITAADHPNTFALICGWILAIVVYHIACRRPNAPQSWKDAHDAARASLERLVKGELSLPDASLQGAASDWGSEDQNAASWRG
jgi:hypothetical protein